ncbi:MAG: RNB domain-containing ribonuclease [Gammaproteobacteria bacterium]|nr:RNB domain-containing ribonuclease [Sideroxydans sp.]MBU3902976.1 RNB domain-containing ribonuclease [Gammaproteobacteria bacterium]MBU4150236.1 RNB domain-containing ribonuclease [Gammaproteobacteria bacterium]
MNIFYEEDGSFKVGSIMTDNTSSLQVENLHGKRCKIKAANVMLRFEQPSLSEFMAKADQAANDIDLDFLWEACPSDEFAFEELAQDYYGHKPTPIEAAGALIRLHGSPMHFYKKGKGRYKAAPADALKAALASVEKKRIQAELQARYTEELTHFKLPEEFSDKLKAILYQPDRNTLEVKALEAACAATHLSVPHLLEKCGALPSSHDFHLNKFLFENFPRGTGFPEVTVEEHPELPKATVNAFSIDDAATTEIDDAFSIETLANGNHRIGIHIAAPALGIAPGSDIDAIAAQRMSTVYMPGDKITMLPDNVVQAFTLCADKVCPALSLYVEVNEALEIVSSDSRIERLHIAANLRHDTLEPLFNDGSVAARQFDYAYGPELELLWDFANKLEAGRGKSSDTNQQQIDYIFNVENDRITIGHRLRGSPIDKVVSELMILANSSWGKLLDDNSVAGIYRTQNNGKVKMSTVAAPHQGLGVAHYAWSSSPLRRYVDLVNQRQIMSVLRGEEPAYAKNDTALFAILRDFDAAYTTYNEFQRNMERYWCLRWLQQEHIAQLDAVVLRENLVKFVDIPLVGRVSALPETAANTQVTLEIVSVDLLDLNFEARPVAVAAGEA